MDEMESLDNFPAPLMALEDIPEGARELFALSALIRTCRTLVKPSSYHENDLPFRI